MYVVGQRIAKVAGFPMNEVATLQGGAYLEIGSIIGFSVECADREVVSGALVGRCLVGR